MKALSDVVFCVVDTGQFVSIAQKLAEQAAGCFYWSPFEEAFPTIRRGCIGDGLKNVKRVRSLWDVKGQVDCFVFPDNAFPGEQRELRTQGFQVWGAGSCGDLEWNRGKFFEALKVLDMACPTHTVITGVTNLRLFLSDKTDKYLKISRWRGDFETTHWKSESESSSKLDNLSVELGPLKEHVKFYVIDPINTEIEDGIDTYCVDGKYPSLVLHGMEHKDMSYIGRMTEWSLLPKEVRSVSEDFAPMLTRYRGPISTEVRIDGDKSYFIDPTCFSADTEILTDSGWKFFPELKKDDMVATRSLRGEVQYQRPSAYINYKFDGEMVLITNNKKTIECLITPDHNVLRTDRDGVRTFLQRADSLADKGYIPRTGTWVGESPKFFNIPAYYHSWLSGRWMKCFKEKNCPTLAVEIRAMLNFLGYYLSEGSVGGGGWMVSIAQTKHRKQMLDGLKDFPVVPVESDSGMRFHSVQLAEYCKQFGLCNEKFVPGWIKKLSPELINVFLDAYTLGDGLVECGSRSIFTTSKRMADDLQELFLKAGSVASIYEKQTRGTTVNFGTRKYVRRYNIFHVCETNHFRRFWFETGSRASRYIKRVEYSGDVYCVSVPNSTLFVRRNGKPFWSGNCRYPSPPHQLETELFSNFADIIWEGANGTLTEPEPSANFGVQAALHVKREFREQHDWMVFKIDPEIRPFVKAGFYCEVDGNLCLPPNPLENMVGYLVATGDDLESAIDLLKERAEQLPSGMLCEVSSLSDLLSEIKSAEGKGMEFSPDPIPDPSSVVD
jgi:hypothetical protein